MMARSIARGWVRSSLTLAAFLLLTAPAWRPARAATPAKAGNPAEARLKSDVGFLADDAREGRAPGTNGIETAAAYIAGVFKEAGLATAPGASGYFQTFQIGGRARIGKAPTMAFAGPGGKVVAAEKDDFTPLAIGTGGELAGTPIVFAGYGISAKDERLKLDYDDYAGVDVKGKAVLILRREPQQAKEDSPFAGKKTTDFATFRHKATNAYQHGAAAVLLVNDLSAVKNGGKDELLGFVMAGTDPNSSIPFLMLTRALADKLLAAAGAPSLETLEARIDEDLKPKTRDLKGWTLRARVDVERTTVETRNVVGVLEGSGPLAEETVVIGGHYDHLGRGGLLSGSLSFLSKDIHNGADDNASGTAMVLEMVRRLSRRPDPLPRRVVFLAFSGEERGLLGSRHYVEHPLFPLKDTVAMVNFDMVGRLNGRNELTMIGTGTMPGIEALVNALGESSGLKIKTISGMTDGFGGSDHQSFYDKGIPVLFAFTGVHKDYHRTTDDADLVNYAGMARIADYVELILLDLVRRPQRPAFTRLKTAARQGSPYSVYLGSMPDYGAEVKGVKLAGVREGSPAEKGGLKAGDVIIKFAGKPVSTIYDYMESLSRQKADDTVEIVVLRGGKETTLKATLAKKAPE